MIKNEIMLGIDIGGTNTAFGFVDQSGRIIGESSIPTHAHESAETLIGRLHIETEKQFQNLKDKYKIKGIGIGAPNANYYSGTIENPPNLQWGCVDFVKLINNKFKFPAVITNDANACALGEMLFGAAKGMKNFIVITLGTGLGSGIVINGELVYGVDGFAGELGHTCVEINGRQCSCGNQGCLETYVSATGIKRTVFELMAKRIQKSSLYDIPYDELTSKKIAEAARNGDYLALEAFDYTARILGVSLANAIAFSSPEVIILFGGLALAGDLIFKPAKKYMEEHVLKTFRGKVSLLPSGLSNGNSAVLGAAALAWKEFKSC
ncbi:MAG: ROK family protein [Calditrichaceae bacterium]